MSFTRAHAGGQWSERRRENGGSGPIYFSTQSSFTQTLPDQSSTSANLLPSDYYYHLPTSQFAPVPEVPPNNTQQTIYPDPSSYITTSYTSATSPMNNTQVKPLYSTPENAYTHMQPDKHNASAFDLQPPLHIPGPSGDHSVETQGHDPHEIHESGAAHSVEEEEDDDDDDDNSGSLRCKWQECSYPGAFGRQAELMRHVRAIHVSPRGHQCPVEECGKLFNRKDNLQEHMRRSH